jgi:hypothetical protein
MRMAIGLAGALAATALLAMPAAGNAQEWCGYHQKAGARVHCGYSSRQVCQPALSGKSDAKKEKKTTTAVVCKPDPSVG